MALVSMTKIEKELTVLNKKGLHARPAAIFVGLVEKFNVAVSLTHGTEVVNGKSIMGILMLGAVVARSLRSLSKVMRLPWPWRNSRNSLVNKRKS